MNFFLFRLFIYVIKFILLIEIIFVILLLLNAITQISNIFLITIIDAKDLIYNLNDLKEIPGKIPYKKDYTEEDLEVFIQIINNFIQNCGILEDNIKKPFTHAILNNKEIIRTFVYQNANELAEIVSNMIINEKNSYTKLIIGYYLNYIKYDLIITNPLFIEQQLNMLLEKSFFVKKPLKINWFLDLINVNLVPQYLINIPATKHEFIQNFMSLNIHLISKTSTNISLNQWEENLLNAFNEYKNNTNIHYISYKKEVINATNVLSKDFAFCPESKLSYMKFLKNNFYYLPHILIVDYDKIPFNDNNLITDIDDIILTEGVLNSLNTIYPYHAFIFVYYNTLGGLQYKIYHNGVFLY